MCEDDVEELLKKNIREELIADGQSELYVENIWLIWWGMMATDIKNGIIKSFNEINNKKNEL